MRIGRDIIAKVTMEIEGKSKKYPTKMEEKIQKWATENYPNYVLVMSNGHRIGGSVPRVLGTQELGEYQQETHLTK